MRLTWVAIFLSVIGLSVFGQDGVRNPQVNAATNDAIESLKREVIAAHITTDMTVADLLDRVGGGEELDKTLRGAEQLGGARWLNDDAVQVRLSIDGSRVARTLMKVVQSNPNRSPIPAEALQRDLNQTLARTFSATGTSTGAADISRLRPPPSNRVWWTVEDADRRRALLAARDNAINQVIESIRPIELDGNQTLGAALSDPAVANAVKGWLASQPVKNVEFADDLTVHLTLADGVDGLWPVLRSSLGRQKQVPLPATQAEWDRIHDQVAARVAPASGVATVQRAAPAVPPQPAGIPVVAPDWSSQQADAEATSEPHGNRLQTARKAEALALEKLRRQVDDLPLSGGVTVGAAAGHDAHIEQAVARALRRARPYKVDYGDKGAVTVHVQLHLSDLWGEISGDQ